MESKYYTCKYCFKEFEPTRRRIQKYCSNTCRSKAYHARQVNTPPTTKEIMEVHKSPNPPTNTKIESVSLAGIGNAAAGTIAADAFKSIFTTLDNKPATKGDLKKLAEQILGRYHFIINLSPRNDGSLPYYDIETNEVVYLFISPY
jgi:hypothetical protein